MEDIQKYIIYGETFNTEDKLSKEANKFIEFLQNDRTGKNPTQLLFEFGKKRNWPKNSLGNPHSTDLRAVMVYFQLISVFNHKTIYKLYLKSPEGKREKLRFVYERYAKKHGLKEPVSKERIEAISQYTLERNKAHDKLSNVTNAQELKEWMEYFNPFQKEYIRAWGLKPCEARDCPKYLEGRQRKYCSEGCRDKEKSRRWRKENPEKKAKSNLKYLKDIYPDENE